jgi:hypothetical protein
MSHCVERYFSLKLLQLPSWIFFVNLVFESECMVYHFIGDNDNFYASKTLYNLVKWQCILLSWANESDNESNDEAIGQQVGRQG